MYSSTENLAPWLKGQIIKILYNFIINSNGAIDKYSI